MVIDACGAQTLQQFYYSQPELIPLWYNYIEPDTGFGAKDATVQNANPAYALQMFQDGGNGQAGQKMVSPSPSPECLPVSHLQP